MTYYEEWGREVAHGADQIGQKWAKNGPKMRKKNLKFELLKDILNQVLDCLWKCVREWKLIYDRVWDQGVAHRAD